MVPKTQISRLKLGINKPYKPARSLYALEFRLKIKNYNSVFLGTMAIFLKFFNIVRITFEKALI